jgi:hypothetical protein
MRSLLQPEDPREILVINLLLRFNFPGEVAQVYASGDDAAQGSRRLKPRGRT